MTTQMNQIDKFHRIERRRLRHQYTRTQDYRKTQKIQSWLVVGYDHESPKSEQLKTPAQGPTCKDSVLS